MVDHDSPHQSTPLLDAAFMGNHVDMVRCLVEHDANINMEDIYGVSE